MRPDDQLTLWVGATRYYLGRMSYAVGSFCDLLIQEWSRLPKHTQQIIMRDIEEEFKRDDEEREADRQAEAAGKVVHRTMYALGMDCDRADWERVRALWRNSKRRNSNAD